MTTHSRTKTAVLLVATLAMGLPSLSACTINIGMSDTSSNPRASDEISASNFSQRDLMFAQMMIPHHEQALEMSAVALEILPTKQFGPSHSKFMTVKVQKLR